jgi:hypothetical protein
VWTEEMINTVSGVFKNTTSKNQILNLFATSTKENKSKNHWAVIQNTIMVDDENDL